MLRCVVCLMQGVLFHYKFLHIKYIAIRVTVIHDDLPTVLVEGVGIQESKN